MYQYDSIYIAFPKNRMSNLQIIQRGHQEILEIETQTDGYNSSVNLVKSELNSLQVEIYFEVK